MLRVSRFYTQLLALSALGIIVKARNVGLLSFFMRSFFVMFARLFFAFKLSPALNLSHPSLFDHHGNNVRIEPSL